LSLAYFFFAGAAFFLAAGFFAAGFLAAGFSWWLTAAPLVALDGLAQWQARSYPAEWLVVPDRRVPPTCEASHVASEQIDAERIPAPSFRFSRHVNPAPISGTVIRYGVAARIVS
jgi:hypothetical protein